MGMKVGSSCHKVSIGLAMHHIEIEFYEIGSGVAQHLRGQNRLGYALEQLRVSFVGRVLGKDLEILLGGLLVASREEIFIALRVNFLRTAWQRAAQRKEEHKKH